MAWPKRPWPKRPWPKRPSTISKVSNKALYWIALDKIYKEPTAVDAWIIIFDHFPFLANAPWHIIFKTTHTISPEPYLHSFQYKIVNRILNCGTNLYKWKVKDSPNCSYCDEIDTLEHHLFYCSYTRYFWLQISHWLNDIFGLPGEELTVCEVLFGTAIDEKNPTSYILCKNLVILLGKWFINSQRSLNTPLNVHFFLNFAKNKLNIYIKLYENAEMDKRVDVRLKDGINLVRRNLNEE